MTLRNWVYNSCIFIGFFPNKIQVFKLDTSLQEYLFLLMTFTSIVCHHCFRWVWRCFILWLSVSKMADIMVANVPNETCEHQISGILHWISQTFHTSLSAINVLYGFNCVFYQHPVSPMADKNGQQNAQFHLAAPSLGHFSWYCPYAGSFVGYRQL